LTVIRQEPFVGPEKPSYMPTSRYQSLVGECIGDYAPIE
jgi:hypothetical protein